MDIWYFPTAVAGALQWEMGHEGVTWVDHYIDNFLTVGNPGTPECARNVNIMKRVFTEANSQKKIKDSLHL